MATTHTRSEWLAIAGLTTIGFGLRLWPIGRLGLDHFDEGIYAQVAGWALTPKGLAGIDPSLIPYAPPGYPILGGLAYWVLGRSDGAMIAVSQIAGTLTIPMVAWLARRSFGSSAGLVAAIFATFSGPQIAYSRMALTDASFLLVWLLAIGAGMRFLERPGFLRALVMGIAVGLSQQFKYNGWLAGGMVIGSALWSALIRAEERTVSSILKIFGWGVVGGAIAWLVVWPWYSFVETHGGYAALLRHQQSYLGGFSHWWPNLRIQADQAFRLSDIRLVVPALLLLWMAIWFIQPRKGPEVSVGSGWTVRVVATAMLGLGAILASLAPYWLGLAMTPWLLVSRRPGSRLLGIAWVVLTILTPFYHPYARLWLPYHALNWIFLGRLIGTGCVASEDAPSLASLGWPVRVAIGFPLLAAFGLVLVTIRGQSILSPSVLSPRDSLYQASVQVAKLLPDRVQALRVLVRPPVTFYLAGRIGLYPMAGSNQLASGGDPTTWALVDSAILRSEPGQAGEGLTRRWFELYADRWEIVEEIPTNPSLATLLDLDPTSDRTGPGDRSYPLWLLRPRARKEP